MRFSLNRGCKLERTPEQRRRDDSFVLAVGVGAAIFMFLAAFLLT